MRATGIVRRIDDLGRVVIPKEIRRTMRIREGDPLEIFTDKDGELIFKKYSPIGELGDFAADLCDSLKSTCGGICAVCDRDNIITVSGAGRKELSDKPVSSELDRLMEERRAYRREEGGSAILAADGIDKYSVNVCAPVMAQGDVMGGVLFLSPDNGRPSTDVEWKLAEAAAGFLGRHMES